MRVLHDALALAEPGGFIRLFVDEGPPMAALLREAANQGTGPGLCASITGSLWGG